jgi:hypothetical protein
MTTYRLLTMDTGEKQKPLSSEQKVGWDRKPVRTLSERQKSVTRSLKLNPNPTVGQPAV